jgi:hypothetical protein
MNGTTRISDLDQIKDARSCNYATLTIKSGCCSVEMNLLCKYCKQPFHFGTMNCCQSSESLESHDSTIYGDSIGSRFPYPLLLREQRATRRL